MLKDDLGNDITPGSWLLSCFGMNASMRFYFIKGYAAGGRLQVHKYHNSRAEGDYFGETALRPANKPQIIKRPKTCVVYPRELMEAKFAEGIIIHG